MVSIKPCQLDIIIEYLYFPMFDFQNTIKNAFRGSTIYKQCILLLRPYKINYIKYLLLNDSEGCRLPTAFCPLGEPVTYNSDQKYHLNPLTLTVEPQVTKTLLTFDSIDRPLKCIKVPVTGPVTCQIWA